MRIWLKNCSWVLVSCLIIVLASGCGAKGNKSTDEALTQLAVIDKAVTENGWDEKSLTEISQTRYSDAEGNEIIYYLCHTAYADAAAAETPDLNTEAFRTIIDPDTAEGARDCELNGLPAAIYENTGRAYLCWTASPEYSFVLEYDPEAVDEAEIIKMAASVPSIS